MQWDIALCRIYIVYATAVLSQYLPTPHKGNLANIQQLYGHLNKCTSTSINCNTEISTYDNFKTIEGKWGNLYDGEPGYIHHSCPSPMFKTVLIYSFVDENLMADLNMGRSHTGIINILNKNPIECYTKLKCCVKTSNYGS